MVVIRQIGAKLGRKLLCVNGWPIRWPGKSRLSMAIHDPRSVNGRRPPNKMHNSGCFELLISSGCTRRTGGSLFFFEYEYNIAPRHLQNDLSIEHRRPRGTGVEIL